MLRRKERANAGFAQFEQRIQLRLCERGFFPGTLQLDEFAGRVHHEIEIHGRSDVLGVAQVQQRMAVHHSHAHRRHGMKQRTFSELAFGKQFSDRER